LWRSATDASDIHFAILVKASQILRGAGGAASLEAIPAFVVGGEFKGSIELADCGATGTYSGTALDCCARSILGKPKNDLLPFGKPAQRVRKSDKALALRTHVTKSGVGLRLMMWRRANGVPELANIGPKFELEISDGDRSAEFTLKVA
jgi:hypothetical protein